MLVSKLKEITGEDIIIKSIDENGILYRNDVFLMLLHFYQDHVTIHSLAIDFYHRRQKFGKRIYYALEENLRQEGFKEIQLYLVAPRATGFWTKMGFKEIDNIWRKTINT